jgi:hypothetical protein
VWVRRSLQYNVMNLLFPGELDNKAEVGTDPELFRLTKS